MKSTISTFLLFILSLALFKCDILESSGDTYLEGFIRGTMVGWDKGSNKVIRFGNYDESSDNFIEFGSASINSDGSFSFDTLTVPPRSLLEPAGEGPEAGDDCIDYIEISDPNVLIGFGNFIITEANSQIPIGRAFRGNTMRFHSYPTQNDYIVDYMYAESYVTADGSNICTVNKGGQIWTEIITADLLLNEGWNKLTERVAYISADTVRREMDNIEPPDENWVYEIFGEISGTEYEFNYSGQIENWTLGDDKYLVFGYHDYADDRFGPMAVSTIDGEGNFSFEVAVGAPEFILRDVIYGFENYYSCDVNLNSTNMNARVANGEFVVMDNMMMNGLGFVNNGLERIGEYDEHITEYKIRYIFSDSPTEVTGNTSCFWEGDEYQTNDVKYFDVDLQTGWNRVYDGFYEFVNDTAYFNVNNTIPENSGWYFHEFYEGE